MGETEQSWNLGISEAMSELVQFLSNASNLTFLERDILQEFYYPSHWSEIHYKPMAILQVAPSIQFQVVNFEIPWTTA